MKIIADSYIQNAIEIGRCLELSICPVNTTVYNSQNRERECLRYWITYCKENNIEIDYEN